MPSKPVTPSLTFETLVLAFCLAGKIVRNEYTGAQQLRDMQDDLRRWRALLSVLRESLPAS